MSTEADTKHLRIAYFAMRYPTLSQTFIQREVEALHSLGLGIEVFAIWDFQPARSSRVKVHRPSWVDYCMPLRIVVEIWRNRKHIPAAWKVLRTHWPKFGEGWFMTLWGAAVALNLRAGFASDPPDHFHGAWATAPATAAMILGFMLDRPFSFGAHAYDIRRHGGDPLLDHKLLRAKFIHTTTQANITYLRSRVPAANLVLSRRGLPALPDDPGPRTFHDPIRILSVGRLVPKKAHIHQLQACAELKKRGIPFKLRIAGDGPLREQLQTQLAEFNLAGEIALLGAKTPLEISELYAWADIFWHTGIVDSEGDRDGLPNVVPEAMAHRLPVISCPEPGVTEAISHDKTGLVVETSDPSLLADAILTLAANPAQAQRLGEAARTWVAQHFLSIPNARILESAFLKT